MMCFLFFYFGIIIMKFGFKVLILVICDRKYSILIWWLVSVLVKKMEIRNIVWMIFRIFFYELLMYVNNWIVGKFVIVIINVMIRKIVSFFV